MQVTIRLHATLKRYIPPGSSGDALVLEVPAGSTVAEIIERLGIPPKHAGMLVCNDDYIEPSSVVQNGQEINVFPPMAGGAGESSQRGRVHRLRKAAA